MLNQYQKSQQEKKTTINNDEEYDEDGVEKEAEDSIWVKWKRFLDDPTNTQLNPEKHRTSRNDMTARIRDLHNISVEDRSLVADRKLLTDILENLNKGYKTTFLPGEIELEAMTTQLKNKGLIYGRYKYQADDLICADDLSGLEILLTEVSSGYGSGDDSKASFDYYKAMFGMLSMMRTIAQKYNKDTFDTFSNLKVHFLHGRGRQQFHYFFGTLID
ncbi:hypothetical protein G6F55_009062 [Rhizopus delemar]|uniref:Uncharacterized protein n=2 Tax=Rhizopus TaxID=4842 RepID=A0A9P6Z6E3_9FUNG|nr:hypothetical protein G6F55_009062 [Rhizopus delemar]KAG1521370.1 hypothetical protein G6F52_006806 [Rhizopus delemar]KAG1537812.1 hypothetical protein G6F51_010145 [Rhizopus arrhizus]KAG1571316.1 hypothetical protein G6F50_004715 [Rhizopus delemar]KAG1624615.1 hypothetical protein G6F45_009878 [Rhizopus arrhizus]